VLGAHQQPLAASIVVIGSSGAVASVKPTHRSKTTVTVGEGLAHDVSILIGVGRHLGSQPRAKTSMMIMRAPQHGHGDGSARGASGATSGCCSAPVAGGATLSGHRSVRDLLCTRLEPLGVVEAQPGAESKNRRKCRRSTAFFLRHPPVPAFVPVKIRPQTGIEPQPTF
jgi:hypothetical protein